MNDKAKYYEWLMRQHDEITQKINSIPKIPLEEQSKSASMNEYYPKEQEMVNRYRSKLYEIEQEATRIQIL